MGMPLPQEGEDGVGDSSVVALDRQGELGQTSRRARGRQVTPGLSDEPGRCDRLRNHNHAWAGCCICRTEPSAYLDLVAALSQKLSAYDDLVAVGSATKSKYADWSDLPVRPCPHMRMGRTCQCNQFQICGRARLASATKPPYTDGSGSPVQPCPHMRGWPSLTVSKKVRQANAFTSVCRTKTSPANGDGSACASR